MHRSLQLFATVIQKWRITHRNHMVFLLDERLATAAGNGTILVWNVNLTKNSRQVNCGKRGTSEIQNTANSIQHAIYNIQYTIYNVQCTMYNVQCTMYNVQCTMYNVQCTMYNVQYTIYNIQYTKYNNV